MKKGKKVLVIIIVILMLLLIAGGAFAYTYFATDLLRTDKELFFKYFSQIIGEEGFLDNSLDAYNEKKNQTPYENLGELTIAADFPEEFGISADKVNDLSIKYEGKVDKTNSKNEQKITVDYGNDVTFPLTYRQTGDSYGIQFDHFGNKFIAIENDDLQELVQKFGVEDVSKIPDKIEVSEETEQLKFTAEEVEQLKQIYLPILDEQLLDENFSKVKTDDTESYTLELKGEQIKIILLKVLEASKQNILVLDKINNLASKVDEEVEELTSDDIDEIIEALNEYDSKLPDIKIILMQKNKKLNKILIESGENKISVSKVEGKEDSLGYDVQIELKEIISSEESEDTLEEGADDIQVNVYFNSQYIGIQTLNNVQEAYKIGVEVDSEETNIKYVYEINNDIKFADTVSIDEFEKNSTVILNNYDADTVTNFLEQVGMKLLVINNDQMTELGLKAEQNPLLYSNPITMSLMTIIHNMTDDTMQPNFDDDMKQTFNQQFLTYCGESKRGSEVNAMIKTVFNHSISSHGSSARIVKVTLDGEEISDYVDTSKLYTVEAIYDGEGYVSEMKITSNN